MTVPDWVQDSVFYQIFPDRFANGDLENDPPNVRAWDAPPTHHSFHGGDLRGIRERLDYLLDLGVSALYLNPIFEATSNHRYNTTDYFRIDPKLGDKEEFRALLDAAHARGLRVLLDGVFNHAGRAFPAFVDVLENEGESPYLDWFHIKELPLDPYTGGNAERYLGWWDLKSLPKFNIKHPPVRRFLLQVARYWIELGIDGWRLDVPNEIDDDEFWAEFRHVVREANPDAYLVGEIWDVDPGWVSPGPFDGLMNYPMRKAILGFVNPNGLSARGLMEHIELQVERYPEENLRAHYLLLGSHDTERLLTVCEGRADRACLATFLQFMLPGAPAIYYGDEIGLKGGKDPECRGTFPWEPAEWDQSIREVVKRLIQLRRDYAPLRRGRFEPLLVDEQSRVLAFARAYEGNHCLVAVNASQATHEAEVPLPGGLQAQAMIEASIGEAAEVQDGRVRLRLAPLSGALYVPDGRV